MIPADPEFLNSDDWRDQYTEGLFEELAYIEKADKVVFPRAYIDEFLEAAAGRFPHI